MKRVVVYTLASVLFVSSNAYAARDTDWLQRAMHWSANDVGTLEASVTQEIGGIESVAGDN